MLRAAVPGAKVDIKNADTGAVSTTLSSDEGNYQVSFLLPGNYIITVEKPGFKRVVREGVRLQVAQRAVVDVQLALGDVAQSLTVSAGAELLETESADRGATIESRRVLDVPLMGRNPFSEAWSAPGVIQNASTQRLRPFDIAGSSSMAIDGGRPSTNEVLVDGVSSLFQASSVSYVPTAEAMSEFKVQTTNFDAQYGWTLGGVINIITKNGTNQFHGSAFEFFQNTHLNANTFNQNLTGVAAPTGLDPAMSDPSLTEWFNTCTLLANGATQNCHAGEQPAWTIRQANTLQMWSSRLSGVRIPGVHNVDISVIKRNQLTERFTLVFRTDFINGLNSPQFFSGPVTSVTSGNFGRISGAMDQSNLPRFIQLSLKLQF